VQALFDPAAVRFVTLAGSRVLALVQSHEMALAPGTPPALVGDDVRAFLPAGKRGELARTIMDRSAKALADVSVNDVRLDLGENPATHLWLWGGGKPHIPTVVFGGQPLKGCALTQSWMARGFAQSCGMTVMPLEDPWAEDADSSAVDAGALKQRLKESDFLLVFVEAPQRPTGFGTAAEKVRLLERMDLLVLAPLAEALQGLGPCRVLLTSDGVVPARPDRVPAVLWGDGVAADAAEHWDEASCGGGNLSVKSMAKVFEKLTE
jgi:2,3-bisphosphoglycerate-independent phosphoglycerate mutase